MNQIISFFMAFIFTVFNFVGISCEASDLKSQAAREGVATEENMELFRTIYETETAWLASLQLENGAIPMTGAKNGELRMSPYFADIAALALLDNAEAYAENVKAYMDWHFQHLNTAQEDISGLDGTIYDYKITVKDGKVVNEVANETDGKKSYDSTDSYAATFISVLAKYYEKTGDAEYISDHKDEISRIIGVMDATMNNWLTFASPSHSVKYLMDNCEVYEGYLAAAKLFSDVIGDNEKADIYRETALKVKKTINEKLWNPVNKHYTPEMTILGIHTKIFSWGMYYPCATAQLFPIACGVIEPDTERAESLYNEFCSNYAWEKFDIPDDFYWGANVYTAALMNDLDRVVSYMTEYSALLAEHKYPLYNADSARVSMAAYIMLQKNS